VLFPLVTNISDLGTLWHNSRNTGFVSETKRLILFGFDIGRAGCFMNNIFLTMSKGANSTVVSNRFIDVYMPRANGSYVKIYLYLLRCISDASTNMSLDLIADRLDETEKDIMRALKYWEDTGILTVNRSISGQITNVTLLDLDNTAIAQEAPDCSRFTLKQGNGNASQSREKASYPLQSSIIPLFADNEPAHKLSAPAAPVAPEPRPTYTAAQVKQLTASDEIKWLLPQLEQLLQRTVKPSEIQLVLYFYESLGFSTDLILYLYDYCISRGKKSNAYIEKVALSWATEGISSATEAKAAIDSYNENHSTVMKAFGLNRAPVPAERGYLNRWFDEMGFSSDMVTEACNRTILSINKPDFKYTDRILTSWYEQQVKTISDLQGYDRGHAKSASARSQQPPASGSFNRFSQRKYSEDDYVSIEQRMLNKKQG